MPHRAPSRRICFVTGTRAEFGLMRTALDAIARHPRLQLQIVVTGMHLDRARGRTLDAVRNEFLIDAIVPWASGRPATPLLAAQQTGRAIAALAGVFSRLKSDIVLVTGDRVEAFAAAVAAHLSQRIVAHVHGGDRAQGQVDDSLRHAITKLAHVHFPATEAGARRLARLGEQSWRIHQVGSPGVDGIVKQAATSRQVADALGMRHLGRYALLVLHPASADDDIEEQRADLVLTAVRRVGFDRIVIVSPNNDPGSAGILRRWRRAAKQPDVLVRANVVRPLFLGLLRDAAVLVGNSSSGIIEAASFHTPVLDIGPRQAGRQRGGNVRHCEYDSRQIERHLRIIWNGGRPRRSRAASVYGGDGAGRRIASVLAGLKVDDRLRFKLIGY